MQAEVDRLTDPDAREANESLRDVFLLEVPPAALDREFVAARTAPFSHTTTAPAGRRAIVEAEAVALTDL